MTQATVSRDLHAIGAVKVAGSDGREAYRPAASASPTGDPLNRALETYATAISWSGNLVVVRTPPGAAQIVASAIDAADVPGLLGTVAGDDTLLVVATEDVGGRLLAGELERIGAGR